MKNNSKNNQIPEGIMYKNILKFVLICLLFVSTIAYSQLDTFKYICATTTSPSFSPPSLGNLPHKTAASGEYLRIMIVYVKFKDDETPGSEIPYHCVWQNYEEDKPTNPYTNDGSFIDGTEGSLFTPYMTRYRDYTLSDYFCEMSRGEFDVIGEEYYVETLENSDYYRNNNFRYGYINHEVLQTLEASNQDPDFSLYNNWTLNTSTNEWEWDPASGDSRADMIVMVYRHIPGGNAWFFGQSASGIATLGISTLNFDNTSITAGSGVTCVTNLDNYSKMTQVMEHEIGHSWWGHHSIGIMTTLEHTTYGMSPYEREYLGYISPTVVTYPYSSSYIDYELEDFYASGDAVKIQLESTSEYFWIANHQKVSKYDGISQGSKTCYATNRARQDPYCGVGKGLYVYHYTPGCTTNLGLDLTIEQSDGRYDWAVERWVDYYVPGYSFQIPLFEPPIGSGDRISGIDEFHNGLVSGVGFYQEVTDDPCSSEDEDYFVTIDWRGDGKDAFNMGYDEIFSPYSNPSSNECDGDATGITVKLLSQSLNGNITVRVYFNDNDAVDALPPSKPKNFRGSKEIVNPTLKSFHPKLNWERNIEPDFDNSNNPGHYNIYRGYLTSCDPDVEPSYSYLASVAYDITEYIDQSITLYDPLPPGTICPFVSYSYKIEAVDNNNDASLKSDRTIINGYLASGICENYRPGSGEENETPKTFSVLNYPNPFNPATQIKFTLPQNTFVTIKVFNALGQEVAVLLNNEFKDAGSYSAMFDGTNFASGIYFYSIEAGTYKDIKKMVLIK